VKRRAVLIGAAALAAASAIRAQPRKVYRIGYPSSSPRESVTPHFAAFEQGLREHGYIVGQNVTIEFRFAGAKPENVASAIRELEREKVDVMITGPNWVTSVARTIVRDIPIVFVVGVDVIGQGFVKSYAKPGGNLTGLTYDVGDRPHSKRLELLKAAVPRISRVAVLYDRGQDTPQVRAMLAETAKALRLTLAWVELSSDFNTTFEAMATDGVNGIYSTNGAQQFVRRAEVVAMAAKYKLPTTFALSEFVEAGGLMSHGPHIPDLYRRAASYVVRILKGAKPADLPVEQPMRIDLVINLQTAKALGLVIPKVVLLRATRVIE